jgi:protein SCO1
MSQPGDFGGRALGLVAVLLMGAGLSACRRPVNEKRYELKGKVMDVDEAKGEVLIAHEDIASFMPAMTMFFPVPDARSLSTLGVGDLVTATLVVGETRYRLVDVVVTRKGPKGATPPPLPGPRVEPKPGEEVPDVRLRNQDGRSFRISHDRGRVLAFTFFFTRCPLPDFCPKMTKQLADADAALAKRPELARRVHLVSISFDTAYDTPEVLKIYGQAFRQSGSAGRWDLATGDPAEVKRLADFCGLEVEPAEGQFTHTLRTVVVDPVGKVFRVYRGSDWETGALLADVEAAAKP